VTRWTRKDANGRTGYHVELRFRPHHGEPGGFVLLVPLGVRRGRRVDRDCERDLASHFISRLVRTYEAFHTDYKVVGKLCYVTFHRKG